MVLSIKHAKDIVRIQLYKNIYIIHIIKLKQAFKEVLELLTKYNMFSVKTEMRLKEML